MHAIVVTVDVDPGQVDAARSALQQEVVPRVSSAPGFVTGYWLAPVEGGGMSVTIWADEQAAQTAAAMIRSAPTPPGVTLRDVQPRGIIAQAEREGRTAGPGPPQPIRPGLTDEEAASRRLRRPPGRPGAKVIVCRLGVGTTDSAETISATGGYLVLTNPDMSDQAGWPRRGTVIGSDTCHLVDLDCGRFADGVAVRRAVGCVPVPPI